MQYQSHVPVINMTQWGQLIKVDASRPCQLLSQQSCMFKIIWREVDLHHGCLRLWCTTWKALYHYSYCCLQFHELELNLVGKTWKTDSLGFTLFFKVSALFLFYMVICMSLVCVCWVMCLGKSSIVVSRWSNIKIVHYIVSRWVYHTYKYTFLNRRLVTNTKHNMYQ